MAKQPKRDLSLLFLLVGTKKNNDETKIGKKPGNTRSTYSAFGEAVVPA